MTAPRRYRMYGLEVDSDLPLHGRLAPGNGPADLTVRAGARLPRAAVPPPRDGSVWERIDSAWSQRFTGADGHVWEFRFSDDGTAVQFNSSLQDDPEDVAMVVGSKIMATALQLQGRPVYHAAAVAIDGRAVLLAARSGTGKSTLTAALVARGAALLSDDVVAISLQQNRPLVHPGSLMLQLYADSLQALEASIVGAPIARRRLFGSRANEDKYAVDPQALRGAAGEADVQLRACCILVRHRSDAAPTLRTLPPHEAALRLTTHTFTTTPDTALGAAMASSAAGVARSVPVTILEMPAGYRGLQSAAIAVENLALRHGGAP